jgi:hypothetical protein
MTWGMDIGSWMLFGFLLAPCLMLFILFLGAFLDSFH